MSHQLLIKLKKTLHSLSSLHNIHNMPPRNWRASHLLSVSLVILLSFLSQASNPEKPNIVFLLADDLGWTGTASFGSDFYETPNLDQLASEGTSFTNAYAACTVCSPTRASILTGMYPAKLRLTDFIAGQNRPYARMQIPEWTKGLKPELTTMAEAMKGGGYRTIHIGKWHLGFPHQNEQGPLTHGFDVSHEKPEGTRGYFISNDTARSLKLKSNYSTDYLTDKAVEEIEQTKDAPFFMYFAYHTPHTPIQGREDLVEYFKSKVDPEAIHNNPTYAAMVMSLDMSVGRIVESLEKKGLRENTIIIFTSDNGGLTQRYGKRDFFTENIPLRRGKGSAYEGGVRVPAIVSWPGVIGEGTRCHTPIMSIDYYPTLLDATGIDGIASHNKDLDGRSLLKVFNEPKQKIRRKLFWHYPHYHAGGDGPYSAVRFGKWRLIEFHETGNVELYDLSKDIGETYDRSNFNLKTRDQLKAALKKWRNSIGAQMPNKNPDFDPQREYEVVRKPVKQDT